jgi:hypothetical protein
MIETIREQAREHFTSIGDHWTDRAITVVMFWPMLPMSIAKGRHWAWRITAMLSYPILFAVNIPFIFVLMLPLLFAAIIREMWMEMSE